VPWGISFGDLHGSQIVGVSRTIHRAAGDGIDVVCRGRLLFPLPSLADQHGSIEEIQAQLAMACNRGAVGERWCFGGSGESGLGESGLGEIREFRLHRCAVWCSDWCSGLV
jgi:hypothetical protein